MITGKYLLDGDELEKKYGENAGEYYAAHSTKMIEDMRKHPVYNRIIVREGGGNIRAEELAFLVIELIEVVFNLKLQIEELQKKID